MPFEYILFAIITIIVATSIYGVLKYVRPELPEPDRKEVMAGESTRQMPDIEPDLEIPEEDQEYLLPIVVETLRKLAYCKRAIPTNAMLIEHLSEALSEAGQSFKPRKNNSEDIQRKNEDWLMVAAFAIRLYDEGTPHNCKEARDAFITDGALASRRVEQWAHHLNNQIADMVRKGVMGEKAAKDVTSHVQTVSGTAYTQDEVDDMKKAADQKRNRNQRRRK